MKVQLPARYGTVYYTAPDGSEKEGRGGDVVDVHDKWNGIAAYSLTAYAEPKPPKPASGSGTTTGSGSGTTTGGTSGGGASTQGSGQ